MFMLIDDDVRASTIIKEQGLDGAIQASFMSGIVRTAAMLLTHLPGDEATRRLQVQALLDQGTVEVAVLAGRAVVINREGTAVCGFQAHYETEEFERVNTDRLHIPMWLQGEKTIVTFAGLPPYTTFKKLMVQECHRAYKVLLQKCDDESS